MRYLTKIIFINSADKSLKYAEVALDGNVHFIGTQGVGKSTLLRAILFFYNADTQKLGIPREKKNYNEYYFPYQNSFIIYEVQTDSSKFCILSFKSQGRVAFRFIDTEYDKKYFIDNENKAFETWEKIRATLGKIDSSRIISNYEEYRNILYGNNKGLANEFRKYALIESRQYQNMPRTIANVFLNAKLDAEFVKETIIKSLNEDEVKIDLTTYSQTHLKDFEINLTDIQKWADGNLEKQAEKVTTAYQALSFLEIRKKELAYQLGYAINNVKEQQPKVKEQLITENAKFEKINEKLANLNDIFEKKKTETLKNTGEINAKLEEITTKRKRYELLKIDSIMEKVAKKPLLDLKQKNLQAEKSLLTSKFAEINQQYEAQVKQLENNVKELENNYVKENNNATSSYIQYKEELNNQYEQIFENIKIQNKATLAIAAENVKSKVNQVNERKIKLTEVKNKRYYETEVTDCKDEITKATSITINAKNELVQVDDKIKVIQKEWEIEVKNCQATRQRSVEKILEEQENFNKQIIVIKNKITNSKNSLYGWLNEHVVDWEKTIGKVIDVENILFKKDLNPTLIETEKLSFYGVSLDTNTVNKSIKTVAELQQEQLEIGNKIDQLKQLVVQNNVDLSEDIDKLKKKFQPKIKEQQERKQLNEYNINNCRVKLDELQVSLTQWSKKADTEQKASIENIELNINKLSEEKIIAEGQLEKIENNIAKNVDAKRKEKEVKIKAAELQLKEKVKLNDIQLAEEIKIIQKKILNIKTNQNNELNLKGADTEKINEIELALTKVQTALSYIETNISTTEQYKYDKEQLFDKEDEFKNNASLLKKQLETEGEKYNQIKQKLKNQINIHQADIDEVKIAINEYERDINTFESFTKTELYNTIELLVESNTKFQKNNQNCVTLITELQTNENTSTKRFLDLQEAINKFTGNFHENNIFNFAVKFKEQLAYFEFAIMLKEFVEENKIADFKQRVEERFANIIRQIGIETNSLIEKEGEISKIINEINNDFISRQFVSAIKSVELKTIESKHKIFTLLVEIKKFNDENIYNLGKPDLFSSAGQTNKNEKAISLLKQLIKEMAQSKEKEILLSDSFELLFKIVENDNDTGWVEKLTNVGSEGTDILVKAMINIMLLNVFKEKATKKQKEEFRLHCMMDEIGKLHPNNVKGILKFANDRNILLINSSPTSLNATDYKYTYLLSKDNKNITGIKRLVRKISTLENSTSN